MQQKDNKLLGLGVLIFLGALVIATIVGEIVLRLWQYPSPIDSGWGWNQSPRRNSALSDDTGHNELGLRGVPFAYGPEDIVVLLLGDSQVEAATARPEFMPERLLEAYLAKADLARSVKVFSLASSGWGNDQQLLALERYFRTYRADLVLVWPTPANDFWENAFPDRSVTDKAGHIKPTFWFDGTELQGPFFSGDVYLNQSRMWELVLRARLRLAQRSKEQYILDQWLERLPSDARRIDERQTSNCSSYPIVDQQEFLRSLFMLSPERGVVVRTKEDVEHSRSHFSPYIEPRSQRDQYLIDITRALLARIKEVALQHGASFRVIYPIRTEFDQLGRQVLRCVETTSGKRFAAQWEMIPLYKSIVEEKDFLPFSVPGEEELSVSPTDRHLSETGNDRAMQILANELVRHNFVQR